MQNPKELRAWNTVYNKEVTADRTIHKQLARRLLEVDDEVEGEPPPLTAVGAVTPFPLSL